MKAIFQNARLRAAVSLVDVLVT